jgi:hypothetical protein
MSFLVSATCHAPLKNGLTGEQISKERLYMASQSIQNELFGLTAYFLKNSRQAIMGFKQKTISYQIDGTTFYVYPIPASNTT